MQQHCQQQILYDNTNSGITSTNVQGAIDELYTKANSNSYDEYTGSTTYTPSEFVQTIELVTSTLSTNCVGVVYNHAANT